jgi:Protease inhibitor Inh
MSHCVRLVLIAFGLSVVAAQAQAPAPSDAAKAMVGAWEISNAARDKTCPLTFKLDPAGAGFKVELEESCGTAFPSLKDVVAWAIGPNDAVRLFDSKGALVLDFTEVESHMYEAERRGEGLFFMRTQAAIKAATVTPEQLFGEWTLAQEMEKPLCKLSLSKALVGADSYRIVVRPGCTAAIADLAFSTWRLESNELLLSGRAGPWRFSESDANTWERIPPSADPMVLMRQQ